MKNLVPQANCPFGPTPAFNSCSKIFVFHYSSFSPHIYCKGLPLWVPAFELDWPILSKSEPCQQKLETLVKTTCGACCTWCISIQLVFSLCVAHCRWAQGALWGMCVQWTATEHEDSMLSYKTPFFFLLEYALSYPHQIQTQYCTDEWLKGTCCWPISLSYCLCWGKEFSPKLHRAILLFFLDFIFWRIIYNKQNTGGWLAS